MISLHKALAERPKTEPPAEFESSQKKRKWEETLTTEFFKDHQTDDAEKRKSIFDIELHLKTPLPSDKWQQYLSVQSGQIHLCNTRVNSKKPDSKLDPEPEQPSLGQMSLDLELHLTCESLRKRVGENNYDHPSEKKNYSGGSLGSFGERAGDLLMNIESSKHKKDSCVLSTRPPSWLSSDGDYKEMIATVCMRCHMLVMLCKSSPACPNCKFMHPPDQNPSKFLKRRRFNLLC